ncbi:MAG: SOS response-associated peptidase [Chloroflexota bacterium]
MCGRFTLTSDAQKIAEVFGVEVPDNFPARFNIAPSQPVAVIANNNPQKLEMFHWGLIPSWAKDPKIGSRMINARGETLAEKPSFKHAYKRRRCLILTDGFYEWQKNPNTKAKTPMYIHLTSGEPFALAGLWESWHSNDGSNILSCTIITTSPNEFMVDIHNRMPVILPTDAYDRWLDPTEQTPDKLNDLLVSYPAELMTAYPVSTFVNRPINDTPQCIEPVQTLL